MGAPGNIAAAGGAAAAGAGNARSTATTGATSLDAAKKARLAKAVKDFEAIFLGMMMKSMRSSVPKDEAGGESFGGDMMESMFDEELARQMAGRSNLGLAEMMYRSITHEPLPAAPPVGLVAPQAPPSAPLQAGPARQNAGTPPPVAHLSPLQAAPAASAAPKRGPAAAPATHAPQVAPGALHAVAGSGGHAPGIAPPQSVRERVAAYETLIREAAAYHGVDSTMIKAVMAAESGGERTALSPRDAKGLMQLTDSTAEDMGVRNVWNARDNIQGGTRYLQSLLERFDGDTRNAIASYNAGPARVEKHGGVPPIPETQAYVRRVMNYIRYFEQEEASHERR